MYFTVESADVLLDVDLAKMYMRVVCKIYMAVNIFIKPNLDLCIGFWWASTVWKMYRPVVNLKSILQS